MPVSSVDPPPVSLRARLSGRRQGSSSPVPCQMTRSRPERGRAEDRVATVYRAWYLIVLFTTFLGQAYVYFECFLRFPVTVLRFWDDFAGKEMRQLYWQFCSMRGLVMVSVLWVEGYCQHLDLRSSATHDYCLFDAVPPQIADSFHCLYHICPWYLSSNLCHQWHCAVYQFFRKLSGAVTQGQMP